MTPPKSDLPQGTLDLLILKVVALGPLHGYAIAQRLQQISRDVVQVTQGIALPGAASSREPQAPGRGVEAVRDRPRGEVLSVDREGPGAPGGGTENWQRLTQAVGLILKA